MTKPDAVKSIPSDVRYRDFLQAVADTDVRELVEKDKAYGASWKRRGGVGAFMMLARKFDRLDEQCRRFGYDIFDIISQEEGQPELVREHTLDTLRDLRRYCLLVEAELVATGNAELSKSPTEESKKVSITITPPIENIDIDNDPTLVHIRNRVILANASEVFAEMHDYAKAISYLQVSKADITAALRSVNNIRTNPMSDGDLLAIVRTLRGGE